MLKFREFSLKNLVPLRVSCKQIKYDGTFEFGSHLVSTSFNLTKYAFNCSCRYGDDHAGTLIFMMELQLVLTYILFHACILAWHHVFLKDFCPKSLENRSKIVFPKVFRPRIFDFNV